MDTGYLICSDLLRTAFGVKLPLPLQTEPHTDFHTFSNVYEPISRWNLEEGLMFRHFPI